MPGRRDVGTLVSQDENNRASESVDEPTTVPASEQRVLSAPEQGDAPADVNAPTIGTGTAIAFGCIAGTILLIAIGLIYLLIAALF